MGTMPPFELCLALGYIRSSTVFLLGVLLASWLGLRPFQYLYRWLGESAIPFMWKTRMSSRLQKNGHSLDTLKENGLISAELETRRSVELFLSRHGHALFHHSQELLSGLRSGVCRLTSGPDKTPSPCSHLLHIYRFRAEHLRRFSSAHARSILEDVEHLCTELAVRPNSTCVGWSFSAPPYFNYGVFEASDTHRLLGCIKAIDRRLVSEEEWSRLWGDPDAT
jgi:hypothetical protein